MAGNPRKLAVEALVRIHQDGSYSNAILDTLLSNRKKVLSVNDQALLSRLFYGVLERLLTLDYILDCHSKIKVKKMHPIVRELLRTGCYQLIYMDKIPASAAVNETVKLARAMKQDKAAGFINAVLRAIDRNQETLFDDLPNNDYGLSIRTSCPISLLSMWRKAYGDKMAAMLAESSNKTPPVTIRLNTLKISIQEFETTLLQEKIEFHRHPFLPACYNVIDIAKLKRLAHFDQNCYYHQDAASQICCKALEARSGERIADVCAAPGGKSFTSALMMENQGEIIASDIYSAKAIEMERRTKLLGIGIIKTIVHDASKPCADNLLGSFDRVFCDVPCSGLGVIRRKPEIRYKPLGLYNDLPNLQYQILHESSRMVRQGGFLQYSTCTLNPNENEHVAQRFLEEHSEFAPRVLPINECFILSGINPSHQITLFPSIHNTDGFYIAGFVKM